MTIRCFMLTLAAVAVVGWAASDLPAQELTPPPDAPSLAADQQGSVSRAGNGPCFYSPDSGVALRLALGSYSQTSIASDLTALSQGWGGSCLGGFSLTRYMIRNWGYMLSGDIQRPERVSRAKVEAIWAASREAAEAEAQGRPAHVEVPLIGDGHGSDDSLEGRTLVFRVAADGPPTYNGIPIVERGRSWERTESPDGRRVWRQLEPTNDSYRAGTRTWSGDDGARARPRWNGLEAPSARETGARNVPRARTSSPPSASRAPKSSGSGKAKKAIRQ